MTIVHSYCLPYFDSEGKYVSWFDPSGKKYKTSPENFKDVTTDGGRFHRWYTFEIKGEVIEDE